jgi:hypothetical protein
MQFDRPHHQRIAHVLSALNGATLLAHGCYFGGGKRVQNDNAFITRVWQQPKIWLIGSEEHIDAPST